MKPLVLIDRAAKAIHRYRAKIIRRRNAQRVADLPDYLLKDIGWPASETEVCANCTR